MSRFEIIESKCWKHKTGKTASLYGAVPWHSEAEKLDWRISNRGYTIRDNATNQVGFGKPPHKTIEEAYAHLMRLNHLHGV